VAVIPWILWDLFLYGVLKPTRKSPARPGDLENRRFLGRVVAVQGVLAGCGALLRATGLVMR
jgi:hypothetical protein